LKDEQAADALGWTLRTTQRRWRDAKRWLFEHMEIPRERRAGR
jgi:hypothetical protein